MGKKYSIQWENDEPIAFEANGSSYSTLEDVPNEQDRRKLEAMLNASFDADDAEETKFDEAEFQKLQEESKGMEKILLTVFTAISALMLLTAGASSFWNAQKLAKEESAPARVVEVIERRQYINEQDRVYEDYYYPVIEFTASDGKTRRVELSEGSHPASYEAGDEVTALYDPEHPLDARIKSFGSAALMWILPGITGVLGVAFGVAVFFVRKYLITDKEESVISPM
ncbi:MAG: hypothetical protein Fur002_19560 [Anaerolineales bacterium]